MSKLKLKPSIFVAILVERLKRLNPNESITYHELSEAIQLDVLERRYLLNAAKKRVEKETGSVFETVRGVGVMRMPADQAPEVRRNALKKISRAAHRGEKRLSNVDVDQLSRVAKMAIITQRSVLGAIHSISTAKKVVKAENSTVMRNSTDPLPVAETLKLFI